MREAISVAVMIGLFLGLAFLLTWLRRKPGMRSDVSFSISVPLQKADKTPSLITNLPSQSAPSQELCGLDRCENKINARCLGKHCTKCCLRYCSVACRIPR